MTGSEVTHFFSRNVVDTLISFIILLSLHIVVYTLLKRGTTDKRKRYQYRIRLTYLLVILLLISLAQIWLNDFAHLLAILGFVAAAIIIVNKESIMNIMGYLIISWRDLFAKGDIISIQEQCGYVYAIKLFYFTLCKVDDHITTGELIRIPNAMVITSLLVNHSSVENLSCEKLDVTLSSASDLSLANQILIESVNEYVVDKYKDTKIYSAVYLKSHYRRLTDYQLSLEPKTMLHFSNESAEKVILRVYFFCLLKDGHFAKTRILTNFLDKIKDQRKIMLK